MAYVTRNLYRETRDDIMKFDWEGQEARRTREIKENLPRQLPPRLGRQLTIGRESPVDGSKGGGSGKHKSSKVIQKWKTLRSKIGTTDEQLNSPLFRMLPPEVS